MSSLKKITDSGLGVLLCVLMVLSSVTIAIPTASAAEDDTSTVSTAITSIAVTADGEETTAVTVPQDERKTLSAAVEATGEVSYQWQILADESTDTWASIYDATAADLEVSYALTSSLMDESGSAYIRIKATDEDGNEAVSAGVKVTTAFVTSSGTVTSAAKAATDGEETNNSLEEDTVIFTINYLKRVVASQSDAATKDENGDEVYTYTYTYEPIYTAYVAQITKGEAFTASITSPTYLGYEPVYNTVNGEASDNDYEESDNDATTISVDLSAEETTKDIIYNVYYKPIEVPYSVHYWLQNVNDNDYTYDSSISYNSKAYTGELLTDSQVNGGFPYEGYSPLYHVPTEVAGDGTTVINSYYDRNYYLITFDLDGGYGTDPVYARYGSAFTVNAPTKVGYEFEGWALVSKDGDESVGTGDTVVDLPTTIDHYNYSYKAKWEKANTKVTIAYWKESTACDGTTFNYWGSRTIEALSGDEIDIETMYTSASDYTDGTPRTLTTITQKMMNESDEDYKNRVNTTEYWKRFTMDHYDSPVTVQGDGSTVVNVYYTRTEYKLRIIYAKSIAYDREGDMEEAGVSGTTGEQVYFVYGSDTKNFGAGSGKTADANLSPVNCGDVDEDGDTDDDDYLIYNLQNSSCISDQKRTGKSYWGVLEEKPTLKAEYKDGIELGEIEVEPTSSYLKTRGYKWTYYYIEIKGKYGCDISDKFTGNIFNPVKLQDNSKNEKNTGKTYDYAYYASVNGEYFVRYSQDNVGNQTIKGTYTRIDDDLLFNLIGKDGETSGDTIATEDFTTVSFLACWENGSAQANWNAPCEWNYKYYVQSIDNKETDKSVTTSAGDTIYFGDEALFGSTRIGDNHNNTGKVYNNGVWNERPSAIQGFTFIANVKDSNNNDKYSYKDSYRLVDVRDGGTGLATTSWKDDGTLKTTTTYYTASGDTADTIDSYTVEFYYIRNQYKLKFYNYKDYMSEEQLESQFPESADDISTQTSDDGETSAGYIDVDYEEDYSGYEIIKTDMEEKFYPSTLEQGAYEFAGWYTSPTFEPSTKVTWENLTMPASDITVYAKWVKVERSARVFDSMSNMQAFEKELEDENYIKDETLIAQLDEATTQTWETNNNWLTVLGEADITEDDTEATVAYDGETRTYVRKTITTTVTNSDGSTETSTTYKYYRTDKHFHNSLYAVDGESYVFIDEDGDGSGNYCLAEGIIEVVYQTHGNVIGALADPDDPTGKGRVFKGWRYLKNNTVTAFEPLSSPLVADIDVYAEWSSKQNAPYVIHYAEANAASQAVQSNINSGFTSAELSALQNNQVVEYGGDSYVYLTSDAAWHKLIAADSTGERFSGVTCTFTPKTGIELNSGYTTGWYPTVSSHSVQIVDAKSDEAIKNSYTFTYANVPNLTYTVKYVLNDENGTPMNELDDTPNTVVGEITGIDAHGMAAVTVRFQSITGYVADATYKTQVLSVTQDESGSYISDSAANVITFYYTKSDDYKYTVHYMLEDLTTDGSADTTYSENTGYVEYGTALATEEYAVIHTPKTLDGFTFEKAMYNSSADSGADTAISDAEADSVSFTAADYGTEIYLYFTRNTYSYRIYYLKANTDVTTLDSTDGSIEIEDSADVLKTSTDSNGNPLNYVVGGTGEYGQTITVTLDDTDKTIITNDGTKYTAVETVKTITLGSNSRYDCSGCGANNVVFYYVTNQYTVGYQAVGTDSDGNAYGSVTLTNETQNEGGTFTGSTAKLSSSAETCVKFAGWYYDEACTQKVTNENSLSTTEKAYITTDESGNVKLTPIIGNLTPNNTGGQTSTVFYAKFSKTEVVFHTNYDSYGVKNTDGTEMLADSVFRTYVVISDTELDGTDNAVYNMTEGTDGYTITEFTDIPDEHVNNDWIFAGWYTEPTDTDTCEPYNYFSETYTDDGSTVNVYAHWIRNGSVEQEGDGKKVLDDSGNTSTTYKAFGLAGVQIRDANKDSNYPNGTESTDAYADDGLRFVTSVSEDLLTTLQKLNEDAPSYGYVATTSSILIDALTDQTTYKTTSGSKELTKDAITYTLSNNSSTKTKTKTPVSIDLTSKHTLTSSTITDDHYNGTGYRLYSLVVTYSDESNKSENVCIRSYLQYTDANGVSRTYYNDYENSRGTSLPCKACITSYKEVYNMIYPTTE